ncbi:cyclic nucleotide-gated cation channel subunit A isoform X2 [Planococcus citri]|uniref:cyclic nucleotide-gated cation channel subunit A isoform X2 n=1 Tax=Planococcus citri TaxID=170843 RepID=UPI0031FA3132
MSGTVERYKISSQCYSSPSHQSYHESSPVPSSYFQYSPFRGDRIPSVSARCESQQNPETALAMEFLRDRNGGGTPDTNSNQVDPGGPTGNITQERTPLTRRMQLSFRRATSSMRKSWSSRRFLRKRESAAEKEDEEAVGEDNSLKSAQHITGNYFRLSAFVVDPSTPFHYKWLSLVTAAILYNLVFVVGRAVFWELSNAAPVFWYTLDYTADSIYILDTILHAHEGYLDQGLMVRDSKRLRINYFKSASWRTDILSCLPTDFVYFIWPPRNCDADNLPCPVIFRANRLFRLPRMLEFFDRTETKTGYPNVFRICKVVFAILILIHWNSCFYFAISYMIGFGTDNWVYNLTGTKNSTLSRQYIYCFYWSTLTLTTIGETPQPENDLEYLFVVADFLAGVLIFATIVGNIGSMISNMNVARVEFQNRMDGVKQYMAFRRVSKELEARVIRWFAYTWANKQALDEDRVLAALPDKLKAEIAIHVHLDTLKKVRIFQDCEPGLLEELVLKLRLQVFSPGDYICRKGDVGKEMYIVKRGRLSVVADDEKTVLATLSAGSVFGEVSVLDIAGNKTGNRRTANVRSLGYSDLFCLAKKDLWETLADYPEARHSLMERGCQLLRKDHLLDEEAFRNAQVEKESLRDRVERLDKMIETFQKQIDLLMTDYSNQHNKLRRRSTKSEREKHKRTSFEKREDSIRNIDSSSSETCVQIEPIPGPSCEAGPSNVILRCSNIGRRSFHTSSRTAWARRRHKLQSSI